MIHTKQSSLNLFKNLKKKMNLFSFVCFPSGICGRMNFFFSSVWLELCLNMCGPNSESNNE